MSQPLANRTAENYVDYQERAGEFTVGDSVVPYGRSKDLAGRVTAVWPAIGMVDVEFSAGNKRYPVEDLQRIEHDAVPPRTDSVPGGPTTVSVPGTKEAARRVAYAFVKNALDKEALYWNQPDRRYRAPQSEIETGHYTCPKCKEHVLKPAVYKRFEGKSERLLGCPGCLFLVKKQDIVNDPCNAEEEV